MSRLAASVALAGVALIGVTGPAVAAKGHDKPAVCHPTGKGFVLIKPAQASSHIDESQFPSGHYWKHEHSGRHDVYAVSGACPVVPSTPTPTTTGGTPSTPTTTRPTSTPSTGTPTTQTSRPTSPSPTTTGHTPTPKPSPDTSTTPPHSSAPTPQDSTSTPARSTDAPSVVVNSPTSSVGSPTPRNVPSSTVAPPELAHTGAGLVTALLVGLGILLVGALFHGARILGGRHGQH